MHQENPATRNVAVALTAAGGVLAIVGSWLPWLTIEVGALDKTFNTNGFESGEEGWWTAGIGVVLLLVVLADMKFGERRTALGVLVVGASLACAVITLTDYQETQQRGVPSSRRALIDALREAAAEQAPGTTLDEEAAEDLIGFRGGVGTGTWTLFVASGLGVIGGLLLIAARPKPKVVASPQHDVTAETKICPRCAETVKAAAVVCRFCGHEFVRTD